MRLRVEQLEARIVLDAALGADYEAATAAWFEQVAEPTQVVETSSFAGVSGFVGPLPKADSAHWIVRLTPDATRLAGSVAGVQSLLTATDFAVQVLGGLGLPGQVLVELSEPNDARAIDLFSANTHISSFEPDGQLVAQVLPDDPDFDQLFGLDNGGQSGGTTDADIDAPEAWEITTGSSEVVVGVIDSGIDYTHPDLFLNIWLNQGEIPADLLVELNDIEGDGLLTFRDLNDASNADYVTDLNANSFIDGGDLLLDDRWANKTDDDGNGFEDDLIGWDFRDNDNDPFDLHRHGTHVAGTIGAIGNNGFGVSGVNWSVSLAALRFLDESNKGSTSDAIRAINYATAMRTEYGANIRATNNSWGAVGDFSVNLRDAIAASGAADILFVAGAGNGNVLGRGIDVDQDNLPFYPASFDLPNIISVAASDQNDQLALFSNFGASSIDIAAPGVGVFSAEPGGSFGSRNGTSMATPHVTGTAALLWSHLDDATATEVRDAILGSAEPVDGLDGKLMTGGRLSAVGTLDSDTYAVRASLLDAPDITLDGGASQVIEIAFRDNVAVSVASLDDFDIVVQRLDSADEPLAVALDFTSLLFPAPEVTARYVIAAPEGGWQLDHNGVYQISLQAGQVADTNDNLSTTTVLGSFQVDIAYVGQIAVTSFDDAADADLQDDVSDDGTGRSTLRSAIQTANVAPGENTIVLDRGTYALTVAGIDEDATATGDLDITDDLTIIGGGATIDAASLDRVFDVHPGAILILRDIMLTGGAVAHGGAIRVQGGEVIIKSSTLYGNAASADGGAVHIDSDGQVTLVNATISGNSAINGGAIDLVDGSLDTVNVTITDNTATGVGGGMRSLGDATIINTIVAGNTAVTDVDVSGDFTSDGNNLIGDIGSATGLEDGDNDDQVGDSEDPIDPLLSELADNGGLTLTHALRAGSPAIDAANNDEAPATDQRQFPRPIDADQDRSAIADIGAVERFFAEISGVKYHDLNQNGIREDGEPGLEGWTIFLDLNQNGALDIDEPRRVTQSDDPSTAQDETGMYEFEGVSSDTFELREISKAGWQQTAPIPSATPGVIELSALLSANGGDGTEGSVFFGEIPNQQVGNFFTMGDINGDGFDDLAVGSPLENSQTGRVYVFFGTPNGLSAEIQLNADDPSLGFVVNGEEVAGFLGLAVNLTADVNGDGLDDLVIGAPQTQYAGSYTKNGSVYVVYGRTEGFGTSFDLATLMDGVGTDGFVIQGTTDANSTLGASINSAGDFNGDGFDDLLVLEGNQAMAHVIFGEPSLSESQLFLDSFADNPGSGGFHIRGTVRVLGEAGDINGDGFDDLVLANHYAEGSTGYENAGIAYVVFGRSSIGVDEFDLQDIVNGDGTDGFVVEGLARLFALGFSVSAAGDVNGDGFDDVLLGSNYGSDYGALRTDVDIIIYGKSSGFPAKITAQEIINGDGTVGSAIRDTTVVSDYSGNHVRSGGDVNGDGIDDILIGVPDRRDQYSGRTYVVYGKREGFGTEFLLDSLDTGDGIDGLVLKGASVSGKAGTKVTFGDINGDGFDDVLTGAPSASAGRGEALLWLSPGKRPQAIDGGWRVSVDRGQAIRELDFGNAASSGEIRGQKFRDLNANGEKDAGEVGIRDWMIYLDENDNNAFDDGEPNVLTDASGKYEFTDLEPFAAYTVREESRSGWQQTFPAQEDNGEWVIELVAGQEFTNADFGNQDLVGGIGDGTAVIKGRLFSDFNGNGTQDPGELGRAGETIFIDSNNNGVLDDGENPEPRFVTVEDDLDTADVDETGEYTFTSLGGGAYTVRVALPATSQQSLPLGNELSSSEITAGDSPQAVTAASLNGDAFIDLVVANTVTNDVSVLIGAGNGSFAAGDKLPVGFGPQSLAIADVDGLNGPDVIVGHQFSNFVSVLINQGDGSFAAAVNYTVGPGPRSVTIGDFDGLNGPDIAVVAEFNDRVSVLLNNGDGTYGNTKILTPGTAPTGVTAADFDGNGTADLAVTNFDDDTVSIFVNDGTGSFFGPFDTSVGSGPFSVTASDLNNDSIVDLVVANLLSDDVSILAGRGNGTFHAAVQRPAGIGPSSVSAADLDNDGDADLVVTNGSSKNLSVLRNLGDGSFQSPENFGIGDFPTSLAWSVTAADIDNDGDVDLAVANGEADTVSILDNSLVGGAYRILVEGDETISGVDFGTRTINNPPTLSEIDEPTAITEDADRQIVMLEGISSGVAEDQRLQITATSSNPSLTGVVEVDHESPDSTGKISFTPITDQSGTAIITVTVTDAGHDDDFVTQGDNESVSRSFRVVVDSANDRPTLNPISSVTVNANAGQQQVPLAGITAGGGESQQLIVSAISDNPGVVPHPTVNYSSLDAGGSLSFVPVTTASGTANISVTVSDGELTFSRVFAISVNAAPSGIDLGVQAVDENDVGADIGVVLVTDPNANDSHTFELSDGRFEIVDGRFRLVSGASLDHEQTSVVDVEITATDSGGLSTNASFSIQVRDVNEFDPIVSDQEVSVLESVSTGADLVAVTATDLDSSQSVSYSITSGNPEGLFEIDAATGQVSLASGQQLDHEATAEWMLTVTATDSGSPVRSGVGTIRIGILDVNEHAPVVDDAMLVINENSDEAALVGRVIASDMDASDSLSYAIIGGNDRGLFVIDASSGIITVATGAQLDHESVSRQLLTVRVSDSISPTRSTNGTVVVEISDVNEFSPVVDDAEFRIAENRSDGSFIGVLLASDSDHSQVLKYEITGGNEQEIFSIDMATGRITVADGTHLDHEVSGSHDLTVKVTDSGSPAKSTSVNVLINVDDVNEFPPRIKSTAFTILEDAAAGTILGTVPATDDDTSQSLTLAITGGNAAGLFNIDSETGEITLAEGAALDREKDSRYDLFVIAIDNVVPIKLSTAVITINIADVNEPLDFLELQNASIAENIPTALGPVSIGQILSSDPEQQPIDFSLVAGDGDDDNGLFLIDGATLQVQQDVVLDYEAVSGYAIRLRASDGLHFIEKAFAISVIDLDEAPKMLQLTASPIVENADTSSSPLVVGTLSAIDPEGDAITFSLIAGTGAADNSLFSISGDSLRIRQGIDIDFERQSEYHIRVRGSDGQRTVTREFTVFVTDVNEAPTDLALSNNRINEATATDVPALIGVVTTVDDTSAAALSYSLVAGASDTDNDRFSITGDQLFLRAGESLDFESQSSYSIRLQVDDGAQTLQRPFTIIVTNVNEVPTAITLTSDTVAEDAQLISGAIVIGDLLAADDSPASTRSFRLVAGAGDDHNDDFRIVGTQLRLVSTEHLDFETFAQLSLRVEVSDGVNAFAAPLTVNVMDVNEPPAVAFANSVDLQEDADTSQRTQVAEIVVTDDALGTNEITLGGTHVSLFEIDGSMLYLKANVSLDHEALPALAVSVFVDDASIGAAPDATAHATISVLDINESPAAVAQSLTTNEDTPLQITLGGIDPDGDALTVAIVSGPSLGMLTGVAPNLTYTPNQDASGNDSFSFVVSDGSLTSAAATVNFVITAVNDPPRADAQSVSVNEDDTVAITLVGSDIENSPISFSVVSQPVHGTLSGTAPNLTYTPAANYHGSDQLTFRVTDDEGLADLGTVSIEVASVNDSPVIDDATAATSEDASVSLDLLATDVDGDGLTYRVVNAQDVVGSVTISVDGKLTYDPSQVDEFQRLAFDESATEAISVEVSDGADGTATGVVTVTINGNNDFHNPVLAADVDRDGQIVPLDALLVINFLNDQGPSKLSGVIGLPEFSLDTNNDGFVSALDVLIIINRLNDVSGEGESPGERPLVQAVPFAKSSLPKAAPARTIDAPNLLSGGVQTAFSAASNWTPARQETPRSVARPIEFDDLLQLLAQDVAAVEEAAIS